VPPVEDDEVVNESVYVPDPVAHQRALVRCVRAQRRIGIGLIEIFADRTALVQRQAVMDQRRDHAVRMAAFRCDVTRLFPLLNSKEGPVILPALYTLHFL